MEGLAGCRVRIESGSDCPRTPLVEAGGYFRSGRPPRLHACELTGLIRLIAVGIGVLAKLTGAAAVATVLWNCIRQSMTYSGGFRECARAGSSYGDDA
jgi:hypothetical protein